VLNTILAVGMHIHLLAWQSLHLSRERDREQIAEVSARREISDMEKINQGGGMRGTEGRKMGRRSDVVLNEMVRKLLQEISICGKMK
jgi:hypothetical protein